MNRAAWWFQNYTFSSFREQKSGVWAISYFASPPLDLLVQEPKPVASSTGIFVAADGYAIKSAPIAAKTSTKGKSK
jgi:hypothetical protein